MKDKYETGKNKVIEDKIFDVYNEKAQKNKRHELQSHFQIGDDVDFSNNQTRNMDYDKSYWNKVDNPNDDKKKDHMQSDIFHLDVDNRRDMTKVQKEKLQEKEFTKK